MSDNSDPIDKTVREITGTANFLGRNLTILLIVAAIIVGILAFTSNFAVLTGDVSVTVNGPLQQVKWFLAGWDIQNDAATLNELAGTCNLYRDEDHPGNYVGRCAKDWVLVPKTGATSVHIKQQIYVPDENEKNKSNLKVTEYDY